MKTKNIKSKTGEILQLFFLFLLVFLTSLPAGRQVISHFSLVPTASAEGVSLKLSPSVLQIRAQSPADIKAPFTIENESNQSISLRIGYKFFNPESSKEGIITFLNEGEPVPGPDKAIFEKIKIVDEAGTSYNSIELGPKQEKKLTLQIPIPKGQPTFDYYFSLVFLHENPTLTNLINTNVDKKDQKSISTLQGGIGLNVLLGIGALETPQGYIDDFSTDWYRQSGPVPFSVKVRNRGLHYLNPRGTILINNIFGQTVGRVDIPPTAILAGTTRSLVDSVHLTSERSLAPQAIWPEKFLLGFYSAKLTISMSAEGPIYNRTIRFAAFPLQIFILSVLIITAASLIYLRLKRRI